MPYPSTEQGEKKNIILVKGKTFKNDEPKGMLKVFHNRVLYALTLIWEKYGKQYLEYFGHKTKICYCNVSVKELAGILGFKNSCNLDGRQYTKIERAVDDLNTIPFYFDC
ncbi:hypothetical protein AGMMS49593_09830 [Endomicrobiia bacterium]|nr:hypothetical protein AGMMS49593_09830 [Endomicrobiia bacterium]